MINIIFCTFCSLYIALFAFLGLFQKFPIFDDACYIFTFFENGSSFWRLFLFMFTQFVFRPTHHIWITIATWLSDILPGPIAIGLAQWHVCFMILFLFYAVHVICKVLFPEYRIFHSLIITALILAYSFGLNEALYWLVGSYNFFAGALSLIVIALLIQYIYTDNLKLKFLALSLSSLLCGFQESWSIALAITFISILIFKWVSIEHKNKATRDKLQSLSKLLTLTTIPLLFLSIGAVWILLGNGERGENAIQQIAIIRDIPISRFSTFYNALFVGLLTPIGIMISIVLKPSFWILAILVRGLSNNSPWIKKDIRIAKIFFINSFLYPGLLASVIQLGDCFTLSFRVEFVVQWIVLLYLLIAIAHIPQIKCRISHNMDDTYLSILTLAALLMSPNTARLIADYKIIFNPEYSQYYFNSYSTRINTWSKALNSQHELTLKLKPELKYHIVLLRQNIFNQLLLMDGFMENNYRKISHLYQYMMRDTVKLTENTDGHHFIAIFCAPETYDKYIKKTLSFKNLSDANLTINSIIQDNISHGDIADVLLLSDYAIADGTLEEGERLLLSAVANSKQLPFTTISYNKPEMMLIQYFLRTKRYIDALTSYINYNIHYGLIEPYTYALSALEQFF